MVENPDDDSSDENRHGDRTSGQPADEEPAGGDEDARPEQELPQLQGHGLFTVCSLRNANVAVVERFA